MEDMAFARKGPGDRRRVPRGVRVEILVGDHWKPKREANRRVGDCLNGVEVVGVGIDVNSKTPRPIVEVRDLSGERRRRRMQPNTIHADYVRTRDGLEKKEKPEQTFEESQRIFAETVQSLMSRPRIDREKLASRAAVLVDIFEKRVVDLEGEVARAREILMRVSSTWLRLEVKEKYPMTENDLVELSKWIEGLGG